MPSIEDVPQYVADFLDIPLLAAQAFLSIVVILMVLIPVFIVTRGRGIMAPAVMFVLTEAFLVGIEWLDAWLMILTVVVVVLPFASKISNTVTGG